jgi:excisionase family DNA binding protein
MSDPQEKSSQWLNLGEASKLLGVHPGTLRKWADKGHIPFFRTPGGHRRFSEADLQAFIEEGQSLVPVSQTHLLVRSAVSKTRREIIGQNVAAEPWYRVFEANGETLQHKRETGRRLFGLAIQFMARDTDQERILEEGRRIGEEHGRDCALRSMSLVDTVRAFFFFRESLIRAVRPGLHTFGQYDDEDVRIHRRLRQFLDEVFFATLGAYEATCRHLLAAGERP